MSTSAAAERKSKPMPPRWKMHLEDFAPEVISTEVTMAPFEREKSFECPWIAEGRLPQGALTVVAGEPGSGKSFLGCEWAARISNGTHDFDGAVIAHAPDMTAPMIRTRLDAAEATVERIAALTLRWPDLGEEMTVDKMERRIAALGAAAVGSTLCRLLIVDNVEAWAARGDQGSNRASINYLLLKLGQLAARTGIAVVALTRLSGPAGSRVAAQELAEFSAAAPVVWLVARDADDRKRRLLLPVKNSLIEELPAAAFRIQAGRVAWDTEPVEQSAAMLVPPSARRHAEQRDRESAAEWLLEALEDGPMESTELFRQARSCGISAKTLRRAGKSLGLKPRKRGFQGPWEWGGEKSEVGMRKSEKGEMRSGEESEEAHAAPEAEHAKAANFDGESSQRKREVACAQA